MTKNYAAGPVGDKIILTSKSRCQIQAQPRKPVKECYCVSDNCRRTSKRFDETMEETYSPDNRCRKNADLFSTANTGTGSNSVVASLLGHETLRRAGRITYLPSSEFLRRVQKRVSCERRKKPSSVCSPLSSSSASGDSCTRYARTSGEKESSVLQLEPRNEKKAAKVASAMHRKIEPAETGKRGVCATSKSSRSHSLRSETRINGKIRGNENIGRADESKRKPRVGPNKTTRSLDRIEQERPKSRRIVRTISAHSRCCPQNFTDTPGTNAKDNVRMQEKSSGRTVGNCDCGNWQLSRDRIYPRKEENEERMKELSKFRRANYFETHGSVNTLVGTSSSLTTNPLPCEFNDRIFVTPRSSSKHVKRIHYYPSYVVREERRVDNDAHCRSEARSRSCDLFGHVVDLGILKIPCDFSNRRAFNRHKGGGDDD